MLDKLGLPGIVGVLVMFAGLGVVTYANLLIGLGMSLVIAGLGLVVYGMVQALLESFGMAGMV